MSGALFDPEDIPDELRHLFEEVDVQCGAPWRRLIDAPSVGATQTRNGRGDSRMSCPSGRAIGSDTVGMPSYKGKTVGWEPSCHCDISLPPQPCLVLDPFAGSCTTGMVAGLLGRDFVGLDLNADYLAMGMARIADSLRPRSRLDPKPVKAAAGQLGLFD